VDVWRDIAHHLGIAAALLLATGFFAGTEVALFALRRVDREQMARSGRAVDRVVLGLLAQPRRLIATVQIGSEAVKAALAVVTVLAVAEVLDGATALAVGAIAVAIALPVVVLLGEVTAKTLALKAPMGWARGAGRILHAFALLAAPVRWVLGGLAELLLKPFGAVARARPDGGLSEEEFKTLVDAGSAQGQVDARERRIIHRVFEFSDKNVGQVMTPRDKIVALSYDLPMSRLVREVAAKGFSRIPIYQRSLDNVRGILNAKDLVPAIAGQAPARTLSELLHEPLFVPRTTPIKRLFRTFKQKKVHLAIVVNEYGKVLGLVTMDDLMSQLFGAIRDEREGQQKAAARRGRGGRTPVPVSTVEPAVSDVTPPPDDGYSDLTPPPVDPVAASKALRDLAELEDERTPPPVDTVDLAAPRDPAVPVPVSDVSTGPSGPVKAVRGGGDS
jgi:CBS domain containing-hemolysin-like protein